MVFLSKFRSCWNLWKVLVALWDYHGVEIVYGHCRVVCVEVKTHKIWCFSSFSSFFSRSSIRNGFWAELGAPWVLLLLPRMGRLHYKGKSFGLIGC